MIKQLYHHITNIVMFSLGLELIVVSVFKNISSPQLKQNKSKTPPPPLEFIRFQSVLDPLITCGVIFG